MSNERGLIDKAVDVFAAADWITPVYENARDVVEDGKHFAMPSDIWQPVRWALNQRRIPYWGEALHWYEGQYWATFSVHASNAETVEALSGYSPTGGRKRALLILLIVGVLFLVGLGAAIAIGGAI